MINATLVGRMVNDPEEKESQNGKPMIRFKLACQKNKETADFVSCTAFGTTGAVVMDFVKKGHQLVAVGKLELNTWTDNEGYERTGLNCMVNQVCLVNNKRDGEGESDSKPKRRKAAEKPAEQAQEFNPYEDE